MTDRISETCGKRLERRLLEIRMIDSETYQLVVWAIFGIVAGSSLIGGWAVAGPIYGAIGIVGAVGVGLLGAWVFIDRCGNGAIE